MDLDVIEYQELKSNDNLSTYLTYDCEGIAGLLASDNKKVQSNTKDLNVAPGIAKILNSKSHKIILQERS